MKKPKRKWTKAQRQAASEAGKRGGRPRKTAAELAASGDKRAKARALEEQALAAAPGAPVVPALAPIPLDAARVAYLQAVILEVPGYDPHKGAAAAGLRFVPELAHKALEYFRLRFKHVKGPQARESFTLGRWEEAIVANLFGWLRPDGTRRYREAFIYVPKKNGKSFLVAGIVVYILAEDKEDGQENYSAAASRDQAGLVFSYAAGIIRQDPELSSRMRVYGGSSGLKSIVYDKRGIVSFYKALAADANHADGVNAHCVAIDELHRHPNGELSDVLQKSTAARSQPMVLITTTADYDRPESPCNRKLAYAKQIRGDPTLDLSFLPVIYGAELTDDWTSPEVWKKANPNYGVTVHADFFQREVEKARQDPSVRNDFLRLHLNIVTEQSIVWLPMDKWAACAGPAAENPVLWREKTLLALAGKPCLAGLDLGSTSDLTALVLRFVVAGTPVFLPWFWMPTDGIRSKSPDLARLYELWIEQGFIRGTSGNVADYDLIRADIKALKGKYDLREVACDPWNGMQLMTQLQADGLSVVQFRQGFASLAGPTKAFGERVLSGRMVHGNNPVLAWMAGNAQVEKDVAGNIKPVKGRDAQRKIDGIVAAIMAEGRSMVAMDAVSAYATGGLKSL